MPGGRRCRPPPMRPRSQPPTPLRPQPLPPRVVAWRRHHPLCSAAAHCRGCTVHVAPAMLSRPLSVPPPLPLPLFLPSTCPHWAGTTCGGAPLPLSFSPPPFRPPKAWGLHHLLTHSGEAPSLILSFSTCHRHPVSAAPSTTDLDRLAGTLLPLRMGCEGGRGEKRGGGGRQQRGASASHSPRGAGQPCRPMELAPRVASCTSCLAAFRGWAVLAHDVPFHGHSFVAQPVRFQSLCGADGCWECM